MLIDQCLDADPLNRPTANRLVNTIDEFDNNLFKKDTEFYKQHKEAEEFNQSIASKLNMPLNISSPYVTHSQAIYTSRLLDYKNLPEPQNSKEINDQFYNSSGNYYFLKLHFSFYQFILMIYNFRFLGIFTNQFTKGILYLWRIFFLIFY